jgi:uncharacterized protein (DUF58 family)
MIDGERFLKRLQFKVVRRLDGMLQGDYTGFFYGPGSELAEVREYQPGDEVRHIDWNVTARMGEVYIRQFVEERELTAWLLVDMSPSFIFGTANQLKRDLATDFAGTAAYLLTRHGDQIGMMGYTRHIDLVIPPRSGRKQAVRIINTLQHAPKPPASGATDLTGVLAQAAKTIRRRCLIFIVSDFIAPVGWEKPLSLLTQRHDVVAVRIEDPAEVDLPDVGTVRFEDPETGQQLWVNTSSKRLRQRYREAAQRRRDEVGLILRRRGVDVLTLSTAESIVQPMLRFVNLRKQRKRRVK